MRPLKPTMVKQILIAHCCSNEAVTNALWPLVFGMFFDKRNCSFRLLPGLSFQSLLRQAAREVGRQNGRQRGNHSGIVAVKRSPPNAWSWCRISKTAGSRPVNFDWAPSAAEWARRLTELKAQACRPRLPQVPDIRRDDMPGTDLEWAIGFRPSTPDRRWDAPVRRMVSRLSQIGLHRHVSRRPRRRTDRRKELKSLEAVALSVDVGFSN